jgi:GH24 family phage-related lysozyme (muramidase)
MVGLNLLTAIDQIKEEMNNRTSTDDKTIAKQGLMGSTSEGNDKPNPFSVILDTLSNLKEKREITQKELGRYQSPRPMSFAGASVPEITDEDLRKFERDARIKPMNFSGSVVRERDFVESDIMKDVRADAAERLVEETPAVDITKAIKQDQIEQQDISTLKGNEVGLMVKPSSAVDLGIDNKKASRNLQPGIGEFYTKIAEKAETDHGSTPVITNDAGEATKKDADKSRDIGYGHKITATENTSGKIHGIPFKDLKTGNFISLTNKDKVAIYNADMEMHTKEARNKGWDTKLANINTSWDKLDTKYTRVLSSLAFNVGGHKAGPQWTAVLKAAKDKDVTEFAKQLRRKDAGKYTAGMDNRVAKELYYSKLIDKLSDVSSVLPKANATVSGIPK